MINLRHLNFTDAVLHQALKPEELTDQQIARVIEEWGSRMRYLFKDFSAPLLGTSRWKSSIIHYEPEREPTIEEMNPLILGSLELKTTGVFYFGDGSDTVPVPRRPKGHPKEVGDQGLRKGWCLNTEGQWLLLSMETEFRRFSPSDSDLLLREYLLRLSATKVSTLEIVREVSSTGVDHIYEILLAQAQLWHNRAEERHRQTSQLIADLTLVSSVLGTKRGYIVQHQPA